MKYEVEASFAYGITKPGEVPYSSENFRSAITLTEEVDADSEEEARDLALGRLTTLAQDAKLTVINEAGLTSTEDANGVIHPVFTGVVTQQAATTNVTPITSAPSATSYTPGDGAEQGGTGEATPMWDGRPIRIFDNRANKKTEKSPDFRIQFLDAPEGASDDDKFKPFWLTNKDGSLNKAALKVQAMLG
jgi:hypothetical protein